MHNLVLLTVFDVVRAMLGILLIAKSWQIEEWLYSKFLHLVRILKIEDFVSEAPLSSHQGIAAGVSILGLVLILFTFGDICDVTVNPS